MCFMSARNLLSYVCQCDVRTCACLICVLLGAVLSFVAGLGLHQTMSTPENIRRDDRSGAVKEMNRLAATIGEDAISTRSSAANVRVLYENLCGQLDGAALGDLAVARRAWADNGGGGDLRSELLQGRELHGDEDFTDTSGVLPSHKLVQQSFYASKKGFRLRARAFMLTFNSITFTLCLGLWTSFLNWVKQKAIEFNASEWIATLE